MGQKGSGILGTLLEFNPRAAALPMVFGLLYVGRLAKATFHCEHQLSRRSPVSSKCSFMTRAYTKDELGHQWYGTSVGSCHTPL